MNTQPGRQFSIFPFSIARLFFIFIFAAGSGSLAQPQILEDCMERLARKVIALPHEHRVSLVWTNDAAISEERLEGLRAFFTMRLETAQIRVVQGEAAPSLRVSIEQTPSQIVFTASVPAEGGTNVAIEQVARVQAGSEERPTSAVRMKRELLWQQDAKILSAALRGSAATGERKLFLLTEESLAVYGEEQGSWKLQTAKLLPAPHQPPRGARGQLQLAEENREQVGIVLPGRRCETNLTDESPFVCSAAGGEWREGRLLALPACGTQTWWLKSAGTDWISEDRLQLRTSSAAGGTAPAAELNVPGPVISIGTGGDASSAAVVVRNISTGTYEVYRVALDCGN